MKTYIAILLLGIGCTQNSLAQTTAIPDNNFEKALIDLGIDSDGTINGQVLTSDIANITVLNMYGGSIQDLTGIEDFTALEELDVSGNRISSIDLSSNANLKILRCDGVYGLEDINLSGNPLLEEIYCSATAVDVESIEIDTLDLSNNPNIHTVTAQYLLTLDMINLKNGNNTNMDQLQLDFSIPYLMEPVPPSTTVNDVCIQVDDETAAQQNQYPYSSWTILDTHVDYSFSENCTLGISTANQTEIRLFPNPVQDLLNIENANYKLEKVEVYNLQGQKVKSVSKNLEHIDVQLLSRGVYFIKIYSEQGIHIEKVVKK